MLSVKEKGILLYIINHCKRIEEKVTNLSKEEFDNSDDIKEIVCFNIFQIGELVKNLSSEFLLKYNEMPWKDIKGMRDRVGHGYGTIDMNVIWKTATEDITQLRKYCEKIIDEDK